MDVALSLLAEGLVIELSIIVEGANVSGGSGGTWAGKGAGFGDPLLFAAVG